MLGPACRAMLKVRVPEQAGWPPLTRLQWSQQARARAYGPDEAAKRSCGSHVHVALARNEMLLKRSKPHLVPNRNRGAGSDTHASTATVCHTAAAKRGVAKSPALTLCLRVRLLHLHASC